jgi:hypothetical protein
VNPVGFDVAGYPVYQGDTLDQDGRVIDTTSNKTHAMTPIDWAFYRWEAIRPPSRRHRFKCQFCGALDRTQPARDRCPHVVYNRDRGAS